MDFKTNKIRKKVPDKKLKAARRKNLKEKTIKISLPIVFSLIIITTLVIGISKALSSINFGVFLSLAGQELQIDENGQTNFLLLGTGNPTHDGGNLTDTLIIASLDHKNKLVSLTSIPRDLYVNDSIIGDSRINEVFYRAKTKFESITAGYRHLAMKIEAITDTKIHYWVKVNFMGFTELVDALGGLDLVVDTAIYDPDYPKDGTYEYETFRLAAGPQHLDGKTALKYVRSRKSTSDFDRADRQQKTIFAIKEKAVSTNTLLDKDKITAILTALKNNIDTNLKVKEMLSMGALAEDFSVESIEKRLIHDDFNICGGFLYTPERKHYNNQFVLIPAGEGFTFLKQYMDLNANYQPILHEQARIHILNGTKTPGVAGETKQILDRFCFNITRFGNGETQTVLKTKYYYKQSFDENGKETTQRPLAIDYLQKLIPGEALTTIPLEYREYMQQTDVIIELGSDYVNSNNYIEDPFNNLYTITKPANTPSNTIDEIE
ncbi:LCP family protein [Candidatus Gracilibacteria bacterium]|nr:LCP family protein [Candidatus Gracilibacteria bacterium]